MLGCTIYGIHVNLADAHELMIIQLTFIPNEANVHSNILIILQYIAIHTFKCNNGYSARHVAQSWIGY